jgi:hypothetical protein
MAGGERWAPVQQSIPIPPTPGPSTRTRPHLILWIGIGALALLMVETCTVSVAGTPGTRASPTARPSSPARASAVPPRNGSCSPQPCANDSYGWIVTISDLRYDAPSGSQFERPEVGNVYVTMNVSFANRTSREQHADPFEFVLLDGAGVKHPVTIMGACPTWQAVDLTPGATLGPKCLVFEAAAGRPAGLALVWTPTVFGGGYNIRLS